MYESLQVVHDRCLECYTVYEYPERNSLDPPCYDSQKSRIHVITRHFRFSTKGFSDKTLYEGQYHSRGRHYHWHTTLLNHAPAVPKILTLPLHRLPLFQQLPVLLMWLLDRRFLLQTLEHVQQSC